MAATICDLCLEPIDPDSSLTLRKAVGFVSTSRGAGGVNALQDKQLLDEYRHKMCQQRKKQGHRFGQTQLGGVA